MMQPIPVNTPNFSGREKQYLLECIESGWISSEGPFVGKFEEQFAKYIGKDYGIAVANGSGALDIAVAALGIGYGDEVILPAFTIISPALSVVRAGAVPVLVDSEEGTWNMNVHQIEAKITPITKAILVVHIYGLPVDMDPVIALCKKYDLKLIEDAAEVHGLEYKGRKCGTFGDISTFSFYPNKHITTGEGGMCLTDNFELAEKCKRLRNLAFHPDRPRFVHEELGWNYRMTNMQAAIGLAQLENIDEHLKKKRLIGNLYQEGLKQLKHFQLPLPGTEYAQNIYWVFGLVAKDEPTKNNMVNVLTKAKIGTRPFFWCMHEQPVFQKMGLFKDDKHPIAEKIARQGFYLPSGLGLSVTEQREVIDKMYFSS